MVSGPVWYPLNGKCHSCHSKCCMEQKINPIKWQIGIVVIYKQTRSHLTNHSLRSIKLTLDLFSRGLVLAGTKPTMLAHTYPARSGILVHVYDVGLLPLVASYFLGSVAVQRTPNVSIGAERSRSPVTIAESVDRFDQTITTYHRLHLNPPAMDIIKDGWFTETCTLWPGQAMSLQVEEELYHKKSKFQDVMVFKRWVQQQSGFT